MAGLGAKGGGRDGLVMVALLIGALAAVSGDTIVGNDASFFAQLYDLTTPEATIAIAPNTSYRLPWGPTSGGIVPDVRKFVLQYYPYGTPPSLNDTQTSGTKLILGSTLVYNNCTLVFYQPSGSSLMAIAVEYN